MTGLLPLLSILASGYFIYGMLPGPTRPEAGLRAELPTFFGLGAGTQFLFFLLSSRIGPVGLLPIHLFTVALGAGSILIGNRVRAAALPLDEPRRIDRRVLLFTAAIGVPLLLLVAETVRLPLFDWEARILWALKAKMLAADPTLATEAFRDPYRLHIHPRYPLLVPFVSSLMARHQGTFLEVHYQLLISLFSLLTVYQLHSLLGRLAKRAVALTLTAVMALSGVWLNAQFGAQVEIALAFFLLLAVDRIFRWFEYSRTVDLVLAGAFLFCGAMTKNEGLLLALCACLSFFPVVLAGRGGKAALLSTGLLAGVFLALSSAWFAHLVEIPPVSDERYLSRLTIEAFLHGFQRLPLILQAALARMTNLPLWHLLWLTPLLPPVAFAVRRGIGIDRRLWVAGLLVYTYMAGLLAIYLISPWREIGLHILVTFDRVTLPLLPIFMVMTAMSCKED